MQDKSSGKNIIWATNDYSQNEYGFRRDDEIQIYAIVGNNGDIIRPRTAKTKQEQQNRIKYKAEVFTPAWVCNKQNNLIDNAWFGAEDVFNTEHDKTWVTTKNKIKFPTAVAINLLAELNQWRSSCRKILVTAQCFNGTPKNMEVKKKYLLDAVSVESFKDSYSKDIAVLFQPSRDVLYK